tara:strand:- start:365 stop:769 length:405 start_codon:yes stop_codon:yes gene_type:complete
VPAGFLLIECKLVEPWVSGALFFTSGFHHGSFFNPNLPKFSRSCSFLYPFSDGPSTDGVCFGLLRITVSKNVRVSSGIAGISLTLSSVSQEVWQALHIRLRHTMSSVRRDSGVSCWMLPQFGHLIPFSLIRATV